MNRRDFIRKAVAGTTVVAFGGGLYSIVGSSLEGLARAEKRSDGRPRLPNGQRVILELRPMGGRPSSGDLDTFSLKISGLVDKPLTLSWKEFMALSQVTQKADVHCVTGWSLLDGLWKGVQVKELAKLAGVQKKARHVVFEAAHGYTANVPLAEAVADNVLLTYELNGRLLGQRHGAPLRALVPDLYFWKSAKWITGIRFVSRDEPGYWETRGYHNHADPWLEERYS